MSDIASATRSQAPRRVLMLDLWATVPYYTAYLARVLQRSGAEVQVASMTYYLDPTCFSSRGLRPDPGALDVVGRMRLPRLARRVLKLGEGALNLLALRLRARLRPPAVLHVQYLPLLRSALALDLWFVRSCQRQGIRTVLTVHDLLPHDTGQAHHALYAGLYNSMDALICHSARIRSELQAEFGVPASKISVIPHGPFFFDVSPAAGENSLSALDVPEGHQIVLWQGIVFPYKGVDLLLEAWQRVEQRRTPATLVVLGTGDPTLLATLQAQAAALGLTQVRFHPRFCTTEELVAAYRAATVVVYPYRAITTSGALATGLSLGKAIVASRLPVFQELLTDGENALLVDPTDPDQLAEAMLRPLGDDTLRLQLEEAVRDMHFSERTWQAIATDTLAVYDRVQGRTLPATP